jgi:branched-chain amino acid transport system substrate-binding protein
MPSGTRRAAPAVLAAVLALTLASCDLGRGLGRDEPSTAAPEEVRIGVLAPQSGKDAQLGQDGVNGAELAVSLVNGDDASIGLPLAAGVGLPGLGGARLTLVPADTGGDANRAVTEATRLAGQRGMLGIVGAFDPEVTAATSQQTERAGLPYLGVGASADFLTERGLDWFFRTGPSDRTLGEAFYSLLARSAPQAAKLAVVHTSDKAGFEVAGVVRELAAEGGDRVELERTFAAGTPDLIERHLRFVRELSAGDVLGDDFSMLDVRF